MPISHISHAPAYSERGSTDGVGRRETVWAQTDFDKGAASFLAVVWSSEWRTTDERGGNKIFDSNVLYVRRVRIQSSDCRPSR